MERPRRPGWSWLRSFPLLAGAIVAIVVAAKLSVSGGHSTEVSAVLLSLGAVLLGAWIALLASHGYSGKDDE